MNLLSRLNSQLNQSAHAWRDSVHLPWGPSASHAEQEGGFAPSGSLVVAVALASVAAALVMVTG